MKPKRPEKAVCRGWSSGTDDGRPGRMVIDLSASYAKLRGRIKEKFGSQDSFAAAMEMDRSTLSLKLNGKSDWTRQEIEKSCVLLCIPMVEVYAYFFTV